MRLWLCKDYAFRKLPETHAALFHSARLLEFEIVAKEFQEGALLRSNTRNDLGNVPRQAHNQEYHKLELASLLNLCVCYMVLHAVLKTPPERPTYHYVGTAIVCSAMKLLCTSCGHRLAGTSMLCPTATTITITTTTTTTTTTSTTSTTATTTTKGMGFSGFSCRS